MGKVPFQILGVLLSGKDILKAEKIALGSLLTWTKKPNEENIARRPFLISLTCSTKKVSKHFLDKLSNPPVDPLPVLNASARRSKIQFFLERIQRFPLPPKTEYVLILFLKQHIPQMTSYAGPPQKSKSPEAI